MRAEGAVTITPGSGQPGSAYEVAVDCGEFPEVRRRHTQDGPEQGTIPPLAATDLIEVSPSTWVYDAVAGQTDEEYGASCAGDPAGSGRFDAEAPHLWFGPRPYAGFSPLVGRTTVEGTDCPAGTTASVSIAIDDVVILSEAPIDQYGDWSVALPSPVGNAAMTINAFCGEVNYEALTAEGPGGPETPITTPPGTNTPGVAPPPAATPVDGSPAYTG